jgi:pimeloyl-ACP methyl ester carboxylesterase
LSQPGGTRVLSVRGVETVLIGRLRIAPDLRVVSDRLDDSGAAGMGVLADDLAALLDALEVEALEVERAVVCGHSMGGYVAFEMLRRHSDRLSGLILCHTRAAADSAEAREARDELAGLVRDLGTPSVVERMLPKLLAPSSLETLPQVVEHVEAMIGRNHTDGIIAALSAMKHRADSTGLLPTIGKQTLVVAGAQDQLIPVAQSRTMAAAIPGAQFTVIPEAGHLAPLEQPVATSLVIGGFLESLH